MGPARVHLQLPRLPSPGAGGGEQGVQQPWHEGQQCVILQSRMLTRRVPFWERQCLGLALLPSPGAVPVPSRPGQQRAALQRQDSAA